jgi:hypothetical protein
LFSATPEFFMRLHLLASFVLVLGAQAALAADPASAPAQSVAIAASAASVEAEAPKLECHQESDIGSMRMHKVCTKVPTDAERRALNDSLMNNLPNSSIAHQAAGAGH